MWWQDAVVYQIYPRSFQDSDGDGVGDLRGHRAAPRPPRVARRRRALAVADLPVADADFGYDVSDYTDVDPSFGTLEDFDRLVAAAHERGLRVLLDLVPCHTSIEHPWFREHPDWYIWARRAAQQLDVGLRRLRRGRDARTGRWYLHSFYPEQPDLDWRNPEVVAAMQDVLRFWMERGVDGFRLDAIDRLAEGPGAARRPAGERAVRAAAAARTSAKLALTHSRNAPGHRRGARARCARRRGTRCWSARSTCRRAQVAALPRAPRPRRSSFELLHAPWDAGALRARDRGGAATRAGAGAAWVLSNHDFGRLVDPLRARRTRAPRRCCC